MTLSSSEVEEMAISEASKEFKFMFYMLKDIGVKVKLPIGVKTDNDVEDGSNSFDRKKTTPTYLPKTLIRRRTKGM